MVYNHGFLLAGTVLPRARPLVSGEGGVCSMDAPFFVAFLQQDSQKAPSHIVLFVVSH